MIETVYIGLGSDLGDRESFLRGAIVRLETVDGLEIVAASSIYLTHPQDMVEGSPPFLNQVVKAEYSGSPEQLLEALELIETELGRTDKGEHLPRTIDLDILLFGEQTISGKKLTIPHKEIPARPFVLVPLLQIDSDLKHPATGKPLADFLNPVAEAGVRLYKDYVAREV